MILVGNLGKDPKVSTLNSGDKVVSFTLATSESWKDKNTGERTRKDRVAQRRDLQRQYRPRRRAILQEGLEGLSRRADPDAQIQRSVRRREIHHRDRAAAFPRRTDAARLRAAAARAARASAAARSARRRFGRASPGRAAPGAGAAAAAAARISTTTFRSEPGAGEFRRYDLAMPLDPRSHSPPSTARRSRLADYAGQGAADRQRRQPMRLHAAICGA